MGEKNETITYFYHYRLKYLDGEQQLMNEKHKLNGILDENRVQMCNYLRIWFLHISVFKWIIVIVFPNFRYGWPACADLNLKKINKKESRNQTFSRQKNYICKLWNFISLSKETTKLHVRIVWAHIQQIHFASTALFLLFSKF